MSDRIFLLPDAIANQIAAGEVIQRPASAVKELLENAVDAGATEIKLFITDAGKALVQVIDNGMGMSETDARMAFERHATSKIKNIQDLFHIRTMGFRGEALASIAAVAQVELKTKRQDDELGTCIDIENSVVMRQEPVAAPQGTSISMKNLFFNVPARRNFLKSNAAEMRHIADEFMRVALAFPEVFFSMHSNGQQLFHLETGSLKQRIVQLLGTNYSAKIVPVKEETDYLNVIGFVGKPETAKRTRGDQYFFVNNRFIKSAYLNHAVMNAYQEMIPGDSFPMYVLFIDLNPEQVDVNVHPTKQEIKFEDEKIVYAFVQAAIKHALAQFSVSPTLDFSLNASIQELDSIQKPFTEGQRSATTGGSMFQTFTEANQAHKIEGNSSSFMPFREYQLQSAAHSQQSTDLQTSFRLEQLSNSELQKYKSHQGTFTTHHSPLTTDHKPVQLFATYILVSAADRFLLIHQQSAHERVIYERLVTAMQGKPIATQRSLFPSTIEVTAPDAVLLMELLPDLQLTGYTIEPFGANTFVIQGTPADIITGNEKAILEKVIEQYKHFTADLKLPRREMLLRSLAGQQAIKTGISLSEREMNNLVTDLFSCAQPGSTPSGRPTYLEYKKEQLDKMFGR